MTGEGDREGIYDGSVVVPNASEASPLLEPDTPKPGYVTLPESPCDENWKPSEGFWWIETALWANVLLLGFDGTVTASTYVLISSDFGAANNASWLTTSYLITSTAFQPLYGRFSDIFGRRVCFLVSTETFMVGCVGCAMAQSMFEHLLKTDLAATVVNSDMIPLGQRGMYQAMQNTLVGFGAILGASLGGVIAESIGWRWCFLLQVPVSLLALIVGYRVPENPIDTILEFAPERKVRSALEYLDISGAFILVLGLMAQLVGLSFGGNVYPWKSLPVIGSLALSGVLLVSFLLVEAKTKAIPVIPLQMLNGWQPVAVQLTNLFSGMASYAYMFMIPLYFQAVRGDSPSTSGVRLMIPSLATPIGGVLAGTLMRQGCRLSLNVRMGTAMMLLGNVLAVTMGTHGCRWKEFVYLVPANLGLGLTNPSVLFSFISFFQHREQAVATSTVYLIRSMGAIYGITVTSAIIQNVLVERLPEALGSAATPELIERLRQSILVLRDLPPELQTAVRTLYCDALRVAFAASSSFALLSFIFSWAAKTGMLKRKSPT
ncbi:uncharacterized protein NECHADRAFT_56352 [Fusarium vanettenii 77-13-4]|uniref:Major facilitator superfamily (MFS) profile domain-containing protein n=1 Tax=Fusarium vanettenii (strain ATCC MYA-4622 / CBS 123669 / FGSC 9596 / NRRL 45880 / 77-13-4) TaxID=660122 RepID=C7ZQS3_FUSV7|nr:uncharacterized protein NECHADRAFT_56352 [Fusarium vanettenii 77-13-4]EEU33637.1 hypothetical protein NECHADRAFT_56352 [Fusarium vanettenii 77-13-4]